MWKRAIARPSQAILAKRMTHFLHLGATTWSISLLHCERAVKSTKGKGVSEGATQYADRSGRKDDQGGVAARLTGRIVHSLRRLRGGQQFQVLSHRFGCKIVDHLAAPKRDKTRAEPKSTLTLSYQSVVRDRYGNLSHSHSRLCPSRSQILLAIESL